MDHASRIFVAGHAGLVGGAIVRRLRALGHGQLLLRTRHELELRDQTAVRAFFERERPEYVFLAAARVGGIQANASRPAEFIGDMTGKLTLSSGDEQPSVFECSAELQLPFDVTTATIPIRFRIDDWALVEAVERIVRDKVLTILPVRLREEDGLVTDGVLGVFKDRPVVALTASREVDKLFVRIGGFRGSTITSDRFCGPKRSPTPVPRTGSSPRRPN